LEKEIVDQKTREESYLNKIGTLTIEVEKLTSK
jgi:hypothetical protein